MQGAATQDYQQHKASVANVSKRAAETLKHHREERARNIFPADPRKPVRDLSQSQRVKGLRRGETHVYVHCPFINLMNGLNEFLRGKAHQYHSEEAKRNARACHVP